MPYKLTLELSFDELLELHISVWKRVETLKDEIANHPDSTVRAIAARRLERIRPAVDQIEAQVTEIVFNRG